jgi:hypothetical protein
VIAARWKILMASNTGGLAGSVLYKTTNTAAPAACATLTNGRAATAAMIAENSAAGSIIYPAAEFARALNAAGTLGFADYYLPARDEAELIWRNAKPVTSNNDIRTTRPVSSFVLDANVNDQSSNIGVNRNSHPEGAAYTATGPAQTAATALRAGQQEALPSNVVFFTSTELPTTLAATLWNHSISYGGQFSDLKNQTTRSARFVRREIY